MARLRVLHVIGGLELGGAETLLYRLATRPSAGFEHEVICLGPPDWYSSRLEERGVKVTHLGMTSALSAPSTMRRLRRVVRNSRPDIIQSWMYLANVMTSLVRGSTPIVWGIHGSTLEHLGPASHFCARAGGRGSRWLTDFVVNCSERSARLHDKLGYGAVPNKVIHNGYDPEVFRPDEASRAATRDELSADEGTFLLGSISRWNSQKDIPNLLKALRNLADRGLPLRCLLIGRGLETDNEALADEIRRHGCEQLVVPLGSRTDIPALGRALDLHLLSSSGGEAFPNVVAETMLSGTPNVVTDAGDSVLMVGDTGWVAPPRDAEALARAIREAHSEWAGDQPSWQQRRVEARRRIVERFTFDRMAAAYEKVWGTVARSR